MAAAPGDQPSYHSYLLRLWREFRQSPWRASLESAETGERKGFADLDGLFAFLAGECSPPEAEALLQAREQPGIEPLAQDGTPGERLSSHDPCR